MKKRSGTKASGDDSKEIALSSKYTLSYKNTVGRVLERRSPVAGEITSKYDREFDQVIEEKSEVFERMAQEALAEFHAGKTIKFP